MVNHINSTRSSLKFPIIMVIMVIICFMSSARKGQAQDSTSIDSIYNLFEITVKDKNAAGHLSLYVYKHAPVYIIKKNPTGPSTLGTLTAQGFVSNFSNNPNPYELQISDKHFFIRGNMAITDAAYDEFGNGNLTGSGRDMFGNIRTQSGWKLLFLHNTAVFANDNTDYSTPFPLINTVDDVLLAFETRFNSMSSSIGHLFLNTGNQVFSFQGQLPDNFNYTKNQLSDFLPDFVSASDTQNITLSNTEIIYVDDYLASAFCDYQIVTKGQVIETGKTWFNFFGNMQNGWKITSWVRDVETSIPLGVGEIKKQSGLKIGALFPNPTTNNVTIEISALKNEVVNWKVIDLKGVTLQSGKMELTNGLQFLNIETQKFNSGVYFLEIHTKSSLPRCKSFLVN